MEYKYNRLLDSWRLVKAVFSPDSADPFIQTNPYAVSRRHLLFHWAELAATAEQDPPEELKGYSPYVSNQPLEMDFLPAEPCRAAFAHLLAAAPQRIDNITRILRQQQITVESSAQCWQSINQWLNQSITPDANTQQAISTMDDPPADATQGSSNWPERTPRFAAIWMSVKYDLALLMASQAIAVNSDWHWACWADSGVQSAQNFGRSPWFVHTSTSDLATQSTPARTLLVQNIGVAMQGALEHKLGVRQAQINPYPLAHTFDQLFENV